MDGSLDRFLDAQAHSYEAALAEIRRGRKMSHWMWYVFPQLEGLGRSSTAAYYGIRGMDEAEAYMRHPVLRMRLLDISSALAGLGGSDPAAVFGPVDAMKLRSCMTLFALAAPDEPVFRKVLDRYFGGEPDGRTLEILGAEWKRLS